MAKTTQYYKFRGKLFSKTKTLCMFGSLTCLFIGDHFLCRDFGPCGAIFTNVYVVITIATVMLLRNSGPYRTLLYECAFIMSDIPFILDGKSTSGLHKKMKKWYSI